jgi:alpha-ketoglutarate-dependent taurine dioxygenase
VFRDQLFTPQQFAAAAQIFGEIHPRAVSELPPPGIPDC